MGEVLIGGTAALLLCVFLSPNFIAFMHDRQFGQHIREEGPAGHHAKAGTPTMGGVDHPHRDLRPVPDPHRTGTGAASASSATMLACGALGFADDYVKIVKRRSLGLRGRTKLIVTVAHLARAVVGRDASRRASRRRVRLRFVDASVDLGFAFPILIYLVIAGSANAVNLTDGLDGLAAGCAGDRDARLHRRSPTSRPATATSRWSAPASSARASASSGSTRSRRRSSWGTPARSALGGAIGAIAVMTNTEILLILLGGIFVIEALSVMIQVFAFRTFRKRVFLMAPIHHHFEMRGWSETKIILRFWIIAIVCAAIGFTLYQASIT